MADLEKGILKIRYFYMYILDDENAFKDFIHMDIHSVILDCLEVVSVHIIIYGCR